MPVPGALMHVTLTHLNQVAGRLCDSLNGALCLLSTAAPLAAHVCSPAAQLRQPRLQSLHISSSHGSA